MIIIALLSIPVLAALFALVAANNRLTAIVNIAGAVSAGLIALALAFRINAGVLCSGFFNVDALSIFFILTIALVHVASSLYSRDYIAADVNSGEISGLKAKWYYVFYNVFTFTMYLVAVVNNTGMMWAAIEMTTLVSAFLVGFYNNKKAIEAAWKYVIICSVGITFALLGTVLLYYTVSHNGGIRSLNWTDIISVAAKLDPAIVKIAFIFIIAGYGTKAGLAPMHTWLPDAHSQAPAPISAMLSGVLLKTAIYAILRFTIIANKTIGTNFAGNLLLLFGIISLGISAAFVLVQKDVKRLLAYSSIEHVGIIAVGLGFGSPLALYGALLHVFNHAAAKSLMFFGAGSIVKKYKTNNMHVIRGALASMPFAGTALFVAVFALAGSPPFSVFISEFMIILSGFSGKSYTATVLVLLFLSVIFGALVYHFSKILCGKKPDTMSVSREPSGSKLAFALLFLCVIVIGLYIPQFLDKLLNAAVGITLGN